MPADSSSRKSQGGQGELAASKALGQQLGTSPTVITHTAGLPLASQPASHVRPRPDSFCDSGIDQV